MQPFRRAETIATPLPYSSIDTDQLIPARFMSRSRSEGYGPYLLHDFRRDEAGALRSDLALNDPAFQGSEILVARRNFGAGSSREAAVYALFDAGFRCVIAPSFGDIFGSNAVNNGLLPALVSEDDAEAILALISEGRAPLKVDLEAQTITATSGQSWPFAIDPVWRMKLLNGWDDVDMTLSHAEAITEFRSRDRALRPWI